jgi:hypothetical protein
MSITITEKEFCTAITTKKTSCKYAALPKCEEKLCALHLKLFLMKFDPKEEIVCKPVDEEVVVHKNFHSCASKNSRRKDCKVHGTTEFEGKFYCYHHIKIVR